MWTEATCVLHNDRMSRDVAQIQLPKGVHYVSTEFRAHLMFGHRGDVVMHMIDRASEWCGDGLNKRELKVQRHHCEGCHLASNINRNQGLHLDKLIGRVTAPGE